MFLFLACSRFLCLEESALGQFNCAKAQSIYRRPFGGRPRPLYRLRITTQQTSRVVGEPCNSLHSSNKDWRCLSVKPAELQRSYPHLDISPGGWVGKEQTRWARAQGAGVRVVPRVCHGASHPERFRLYDAFLSDPLTGTCGVVGSTTTACLQFEGGARASKGAYTFH